MEYPHASAEFHPDASPWATAVRRSGRAASRRRVARERAVAAVSEGLLQGLSRLGRMHPRADPARHRVEVIRDVAYAPGDAMHHRLDVYRPSARPGPVPVVLYVHGGGFRVLSKDTHWLMGLVFARAGYAVFNISYRLAPRHPFPAAIADTCAAFRWVVDHARRFGGDPSRVVVAGESAGANLIAALTVATCYQRPEPWAQDAYEPGVVPAAAIPFCGLLQVTQPGRFSARRRVPFWAQDIITRSSRAYLGDRMEDVGAAALDLADPLLVFERGAPPDRPLPPFFVPVGTRDPVLPDTRRLAAALAQLGVRCEARYYPGEIHAFQALIWRRRARQAWRDTLAFLADVAPA